MVMLLGFMGCSVDWRKRLVMGSTGPTTSPVGPQPEFIGRQVLSRRIRALVKTWEHSGSPQGATVGDSQTLPLFALSVQHHLLIPRQASIFRSVGHTFFLGLSNLHVLNAWQLINIWCSALGFKCFGQIRGRVAFDSPFDISCVECSHPSSRIKYIVGLNENSRKVSHSDLTVVYKNAFYYERVSSDDGQDL